MAGQSNKRAIRNLKNEKFFAGLVDFPRAPNGTDIKNRKTGERFEIPTFARDTATGDLWYLAAYAAGVADWRKLADAEGAVTTLLDQVDAEVDPNTAGQIAIDGLAVANAANPSGIPVETVAGTNTLVVQTQVGAAITGAPADKNDAGLLSANDAQFATTVQGYLSLKGGTDLPGIQTITSDDPTIVGPDASGNVDLTGEAVANATNAKPVYVDAGTNALNVEVQVGAAVTGAPGDKNDAGLSSYNDTQFTQDANGYVALAGGTDLPGIQTLTGDSGGAIGPAASGDVGVVGGAGISVVGTTNTITITASGGEEPVVGAINLGITYASSTLSVTAADGSALSASNKGFITMQDPDNPGQLLTFDIEANQGFIDDTGASEIINNLFGTTTSVAWAQDVPFYIYAVWNSDSATNLEPIIAFMASRVPHATVAPAAASIGAPDDAVADTQGSFFSFDNITEADYAAQPCICIGSFRMQMSASDDWTVQALSAGTDGIGMFQENVNFVLPAGQNGAASGKYFRDNGGTAPGFTSNSVTYRVFRNGFFNSSHCYETVNVTGVGAVECRGTLPYKMYSPGAIRSNCGIWVDNSVSQGKFVITQDQDATDYITLSVTNVNANLTNGAVNTSDSLCWVKQAFMSLV